MRPNVARVPWPAATAWWPPALLIGFFQVVGSFGAQDNQPERRALDALALALLLVGPAFLFARDRWPLASAVAAIGAADVYIAAGYPFGPIFASVVVTLFTLVGRGRRRQAWLLAAAGFAGFVVAISVDTRPGSEPNALHLALVVGWLVVVLAVAEVVRMVRLQAAERAQAVAEERRRRAGEQRLHLAQELHDVLAHNISLINVQASVALHLLDDQPDQARPALATIKEASHDALQELRGALELLRRGDDDVAPAPLVPAPKLADVATLVDGVRAGGLRVTLEQEDPTTPVPPAVDLAAYRIVQEALTNVTRHARASAVTVRVDHGDGVRLEVTDNGVGGAAAPGNGITGMQERAAALGGWVEAGPAPGGGFRVVAHLPGRRP